MPGVFKQRLICYNLSNVYKEKIGEALHFFCQEFGVPERLTMYGAPDQVGQISSFMNEVQKRGIYLQVIEHKRHNQNPSKGII